MINIIRSTPPTHTDLGVPVSEERKDKVNKDIFNKEVRILDFTVLLNTAASLKKEKEENYRGEVPEENEYRKDRPMQWTPSWRWEGSRTSREWSTREP
jgi:hypothetical protein